MWLVERGTWRTGTTKQVDSVGSTCCIKEAASSNLSCDPDHPHMSLAVFLHFSKNISIVTSIRSWPLPSVFLPVSYITLLVFDAIFLIYWLPLSMIQTKLQWGIQNPEDSYIWAVHARDVCQIIIFMMTLHFSSSGLQIGIYSFHAFRNSCWRTMSGTGGFVKNWQNSCWPQ